MAQAQIQIASGELAQAEAQYNKLANGGTPAEIAVLEAEVARAEAALSQAKAALDKAKIIAPFSGTIGNVLYKSGEVVRIAPMVSAGQGGTNFTTTIKMSDPPKALRWGMTAFVDIDVE